MCIRDRAIDSANSGHVQLLNVPARTMVTPFPDQVSTGRLAFNPEGTLLAATLVQDVVVWSVSDRRIVSQIHHEFDPADLAAMETPRRHPPFATLSQVGFTADSQRVIAYDDLNGYVWDIASGRKVATVPGQGGAVHPNSPELILTRAISINEPYTSTMMLWDIDRRSARWSADPPSRPFFSSDGTLAVARTDQQFELLTTASGQPVTAITTSDELAQFSPDGTMFITADSLASQVHVWNVADGRLIQTMRIGHVDSMLAFTATHDNQYILVSHGFDPGDFGPGPDTPVPVHRSIHVWRVADGKLVQGLTAHTDIIKSLAFSPDGHLLASGSLDKTVKLWRYQP